MIKLLSALLCGGLALFAASVLANAGVKVGRKQMLDELKQKALEIQCEDLKKKLEEKESK